MEAVVSKGTRFSADVLFFICVTWFWFAAKCVVC